jgi:RimJ/RimL family protein N-acetyltransferase
MVNWYWECRETDWRRIGIGLYEPSARGRGIGTEALQLWTTYLFETTDALRLDLSTYSGNPAMCRAAAAAGFVLEGRLRAARRWSGGVHDAMIYAAYNDTWTASR